MRATTARSSRFRRRHGARGAPVPRCRGARFRHEVWTWTTQAYAPKPPFEEPPSGFEPFVVGYVDLGGVLVESRIIGAVAIGDQVELRLLSVSDTEVTFAFEKVER